MGERRREKSRRPATGKRHRGREMALQMLYQSDMGGATVPQVLRYFDPRAVSDAAHDEENATEVAGRPGERPQVLDAAMEYARQLVRGTMEHREELDELIRGQAENWRLERMPAVDRNILRLAVYELLYENDVPDLVVLDEAIELAKRFGSEQSSRFVNGLLDGLLRARGAVR